MSKYVLLQEDKDWLRARIQCVSTNDHSSYINIEMEYNTETLEPPVLKMSIANWRTTRSFFNTIKNTFAYIFGRRSMRIAEIHLNKATITPLLHICKAYLRHIDISERVEAGIDT